MDFLKINNITIDGIECTRVMTDFAENGDSRNLFMYEKDGDSYSFIITHHKEKIKAFNE